MSIEATVPAKLSGEESLIWLGNYLADHLGAQGLGRLWGNSDVLQNIAWSMPILEYYILNPDEEIDTRCVPAPDGTPLGELRSKGDQLAQFLKWEPCDAVHHLLTGGLVASSGVQVETQIQTIRVIGENHQMTLTITDPGSVTEKDLIAAFQKGRSKIPSRTTKRTIKRARVALRSEQVITFVLETPTMHWGDRLNEWNRRNPEARFSTLSAIKEA